MARKSTRKMTTTTAAAYKAHLTRAKNALTATRSKTERAALREKIATLEATVGGR